MLEDFEVEKIIVSDYFKLPNEDLQQFKKHNISIEQVNRDDSIVIQGQKFHVIAPNKNHYSNNENSLVLYTELGGNNWLFTGDISKSQEKEIMDAYPNLRADVLKVAHHGSNTSSDKGFLDQLKPDVGLISVGENNMYGHPTSEVLADLKEKGIYILRTDMDGAVQYRFNGRDGTFFTFLP
ncbi:ComEC/Rec2 family competence protein [Oceanobacillus zhaokaii]|nr:hypothetical protein [Oceanobacillus zhaokaii]